MYLLFETIKIENGVPLFPEWHEKRMNESIRALSPGSAGISLCGKILVPDKYKSGIVKCNVLYDREIRKVTFNPYEKRVIKSYRLVNSDSIDYQFKYANRQELDKLFAQRGNCDEIIIVKNGRITDTSISNLIFTDGSSWFTPDQPLLNGTCRRRLLASGQIQEQTINPEDLQKYSGFKMINAMRQMEDGEVCNVDMIRTNLFRRKDIR